MERIDKFLNHYQKLDQYLQRNNGKTRDLPFSRRIDEFVQDHPGYRQKAPKLKDYGDLRNAMIHQRDPQGGWIAEPSESALQDFDQIVQSIVDPPKLIPEFQKDIRTF